jgi:uncharacterized protein YecE (DUF72 family)
MKRLTDMERGVGRSYESIALRAAPPELVRGAGVDAPARARRRVRAPRRPPRSSRQLLRAELREWAARVRGLTESAEVFAFFNNDWEVFAPRNAKRLRELVEI